MGALEVTRAILESWTQAEYGAIVKVALITIPIVLYAIFIFYFYRFLAKKNIIELNLRQYNNYSSGFLVTIIPTCLYIIEYIIILPVITFFWFAILSVLVFFLAAQVSLQSVLLISAALITSVRVTAYISESLSQDLAKMLPLTLLGIALTNPLFFNFTQHLSRVSEVPSLFTDILYFLVFIIMVELIMRLFDLIRQIGYETKAMKTDDETGQES